MTVFFSSFPSPAPRLASPLILLGLLLLLSGCSDSDSSSGAGTGTQLPSDPDAGDNDTGGNALQPPTGGLCDGTKLSYKDGKGLHEIDCADVYQGGVCVQAGLTAQCQVPIGNDCFLDDDGTTRTPRCAGMKAACVAEELDGQFTCMSNVGSCSTGDVGKCLPGNQYAVRVCLNGQPRVYDCSAMGGRCAGNGCLDLPMGADCETDLKTGNKYLVCRTNYDPALKRDIQCYNSNPLKEFGTCVTMQDEDETCETDAQTTTKEFICKKGLICYNSSSVEQFGKCVVDERAP